MLPVHDAATPVPPLTRMRFSTRQREVLAQLEGIVLREGFAQLTVAEAVGRLRCSRRTLYTLAPTRDELVLLVIDRWYQRAGRDAELLLQIAGTARERLEGFLLETVRAMRIVGPQFWRDVETDLAVNRLVNAHVTNWTARLAHLVRDGVSAGEFRPINPHVAAQAIYAAFERFTHPEVVRDLQLAEGTANDEVVRLFVLGVVHRDVQARTTPAGAST